MREVRLEVNGINESSVSRSREILYLLLGIYTIAVSHRNYMNGCPRPITLGGDFEISLCDWPDISHDNVTRQAAQVFNEIVSKIRQEFPQDE